MEINTHPPKPLDWVGSSYKDFMGFPIEVKKQFGYDLHKVQANEVPNRSKVLKGALRGAVELLDDHAGDTYRAVYTVKFGEVVYVLHAFKKKSKSGIATPKADVDLIRKRLAAAEADYKERQEQQK